MTTPSSSAPQNAAIHSGRFSLQIATRSPCSTPDPRSRAANACARRPTSAYVHVHVRYPSSYVRNPASGSGASAEAMSLKKSSSVRRVIAMNYDRKFMALPPVFAASALYDNLLQAALRQFFERATFETEATPSLSSDGRLAIEPTGDPAQLAVRWFGTRHLLRVPSTRPFTAHEIRLARAIGSVLTARYRAIFDPRQMVERGDLFRGAIEDRYIAAFLDDASGRHAPSRADLIAAVIEVLRVAAL